MKKGLLFVTVADKTSCHLLTSSLQTCTEKRIHIMDYNATVLHSCL